VFTTALEKESAPTFCCPRPGLLKLWLGVAKCNVGDAKQINLTNQIKVFANFTNI